jgi:hypothetical protein
VASQLEPLLCSLFNPKPIDPAKERYFAIVIKADAASLAGLYASTTLGNLLRDRERELLPPGAKITRSIEITKDMATRTW